VSVKQRLNPTLFDKLVADLDLTGGRQDEAEAAKASLTITRDALKAYIPNIEQFNETALRATVRRELAWLLNTVSLESLVDLTRYPEVRTSVLNYGVADLTGKAASVTALNVRGNRIREAILAFEPRLARGSVAVTARNLSEADGAPDARLDNAVAFDIHGDVTAAVQPMPVRFVTEVEIDTGAATLRD